MSNLISIEQIGTKDGDNSNLGDNCEKCQTEEKPIYWLKNDDYEIDIILCPKCLEKFKQNIAAIQI